MTTTASAMTMNKKERSESINLMAISNKLEEGNTSSLLPPSPPSPEKKKKKKKHHYHNQHAIQRFGEDNGSSSNTVTDGSVKSGQQAAAKQASSGGGGVRFTTTTDKKHDEKDDYLKTNFEVATWHQMARECCYHSSREWLIVVLQLVAVAACLYFFIFGIELLGESAKVMFGCKAGALFNDDANPLSALMIGILATVLMQSSSTSTAVVASMVEAQVLTVKSGIYMVMGANVGTAMTSTIVSFGHFHAPAAATGPDKTQRFRRHEFDRAFAAATLHDMFNMCTVALLFPLECATGYLSMLTSVLVEGAETGQRDDHYVGPVKQLVSPLTKLLIISNKKVTTQVAEGEKTCQDFYPIECDPYEAETYDTCPKVGLIACNKDTNKCPIFFRADATMAQDQVAGVVCFIFGLIVLFVSMMCFTHVIQKLLFGMSKNVVHTATSCNGYISILVGIGTTMIVQSSSTVTCVLVPLVATEALRLETAYPVIVGANIGTAIGAVIVSMESIGTNPLQVALAHLFFNLTGALLWYPLPPLRNVIYFCTRRLVRGAEIWRWFALIYMIGAFILVPFFFLELSNLYTKDTTSSLVTAILLTIAFAGGLAWLTYWCKVQGGDVKYVRFIKALKKGTSKDKKKSSRKDNHSAAIGMGNGDPGSPSRRASTGSTTAGIPNPTAKLLATLHHPSLEEKQQLHLQQLTMHQGTSLAYNEESPPQGSEVANLVEI